MSNALQFTIDILSRMQGNAVSEVQRLEVALKSAESDYKALTSAATKAQAALESNAAKLAQAQEIAAKIGAEGDKVSYDKAVAEVGKLVKKEKELATAAHKAAEELKKQGKHYQEIADQTGKAKKAEKEIAAGKDKAKAAENLGKLKGAVGSLPGPLGKAGSKALDMADNFKDMAEGMGKGAAVGVTAAAAIALVIVALYAGIAALMIYSVKMADAARTTRLTAEAWMGSKAAGDAMTATWRKVERQTGIGVDRQIELTKSLKAAKVAAKDMPDALKAIALQEQALGDQSGTQELIDNLKAGKKTAAEMSAEMETQFGGVVAQKMRSLDNLGSRMKSNLANLFGSLDIEPLLKGLEKIVDMFDESSASGKALKQLFEDIGQPLINAFADAMPSIQRFIIGLEIGFYKVAAVIKPFAGTIKEAFTTGPLSKFISAADAGKYVMYGLGIVIATVALASVASIALMALPFAVVAAAIYGVVKAYQELKSMFSQHYKLGAAASGEGLVKIDADSWMKDQARDAGMVDLADAAKPQALNSGQEIAKMLTAGIVGGIEGGQGAINAAAAGAVDSATSAAKAAADAHSPSRLWGRLGRDMTAGLAIGIDDGKGDVERAAGDIGGVTPPVGNTDKSTRSNVVTINLTIQGNADEAMLARTKEMLTAALEDAGIEMGAPVLQEAA